jgi:phosphatidylserine/phosphatidylglycerophosphate/cardiolipin synthase-like enzyme
MTMLERVIRPSRVTKIRVDPVLTTVLAAELVAPSKELWLVSSWISDVVAVDNTRGDYDSLFADAAARAYHLSEVLALLTTSGSTLTVVTRSDRHNELFVNRLTLRADRAHLHVVRDADVHEKTLCGTDWMLSGSMNFTMRGMQVNDEAITYKLSDAAAAGARIDFARRWRTVR